MKRKTRLIIALIGVFLFIAVSFAQLIFALFNEQYASNKVSLPEYNDLFNKDSLSRISILATTTSKNREAFSNYEYTYVDIFVYKKMVMAKNISLSELLHYKNTESDRSSAVYLSIGSSNFEMDLKTGRSSPASSVFLKSTGDSISIIAKNDSVYCYHLKFKTFSISYDNEVADVFARSERPNTPASIAFIKRRNWLYVLIMSVPNEKKDFRPDLLYRLLQK